jgi:hypothetical protein
VTCDAHIAFLGPAFDEIYVYSTEVSDAHEYILEIIQNIGLSNSKI